MPNSIIELICDLPIMKVLSGLTLTAKQLYLRELAAHYSLSPSGVSDIIRRLKKAGLVKESKEKKKIYYSLDLTDGEFKLLKNLFLLNQKIRLEKRAVNVSRRAQSIFKWMDDAHSSYSKIRKHKR